MTTTLEVAEKSLNAVIPSAARDLLFLDFEVKSRFLAAALFGMTPLVLFFRTSLAAEVLFRTFETQTKEFPRQLFSP